MRLGKAATIESYTLYSDWSRNILSLLYWLARPIWWESGTQAEKIFFSQKRSCPKWESSCFSAVFLGVCSLCVYILRSSQSQDTAGKQPEDSLYTKVHAMLFFLEGRERNPMDRWWYWYYNRFTFASLAKTFNALLDTQHSAPPGAT